MKINVKILQGAECNVDITAAESVDRLKELVQTQLNISPAHQRLLHKGKTLQDGTLVQEYSLKEGDKLHLVVKKDATPPAAAAAETTATVATNTGCIETQTELLPRVLLEREMTRILRSHYSSDAEVRKVVGVFVKNVERKLNNLSLDDIERICERWNTEQVIQF